MHIIPCIWPGHERYKYHCQSRYCQCCFYYCRFICFVEHILIIDIFAIKFLSLNKMLHHQVLSSYSSTPCVNHLKHKSHLRHRRNIQQNNDIGISRLKKQRKTFLSYTNKERRLGL